jgi:hypothetical protein
MNRPHRFLIAPAVTLFLGACTTWGHAGVDVLARPVPERRPLEVWSGGTRHDVHGVRAVGDSVVMVPHWKPPACDSCRIVLPRVAVDSVRVRVHSPVRTMVLVGILGGALWLAAQFLPVTPDY